MTSIVKYVIAAGFAGSCVLSWFAVTDRDVLSAQEAVGAPSQSHVMKIKRIYTGPDGLTYLDEVEMPSGVMKVAGWTCRRASPRPFGDWHPAPRRQYVITLEGMGEIEVSGGGKFLTPPGHVELLENTTGKGHRTRVVGPGDRVSCQLPLAE